MSNAVSRFFSKIFTAPAVARYEFDRDRRLAEMSASGYHSNRSFGNVTSGAKSPGGMSYSGMGRIYDHSKLRLNVRDAMYDSVHARGIVQRFSDTIVDTGLKLRLEPNFRMLGISQTESSRWSTEVSEAFDLWAQSTDSDVTGTNNFYQNQHLYCFAQQRENDMFTRLHYSKNSQLISPLQIQFIDPDQIGGCGYTSTNGYIPFTAGNGFTDGIKRDGNGKEIEYLVTVVDSKGQYKQVPVRAQSSSGRRLFLHGFNKEYAGQGRGFSRLSHALNEFEQLTDFTQAQICKAINQSQFAFYTKPSSDAPASNPLADFAVPAGPKPSNFIGATPGQTSEITTGDVVDFRLLNEYTARQPGSAWVANLTEGEDLKTVDNSAPSDSFDKFVDAFVTYLSASVSMPIEVLLMKFGENYSASRATLVLFWRVIQLWRAEMASDLLNPIVESWISEEIGAGRVTAPGWSDPRMRAAWCKCRWIGAPVPSIDPKKEADADGIRSSLGHLTLADGAMGFNASNGESNRAALAKEIPELVVTPWSPSFKFINDGKPIGEERVTETNVDTGDEGDTDDE